MRLEHEAGKLPQNMELGRMWGVVPDAALLETLESARLRLSNLRAALKEYRGRDTREEINTTIARGVEALAEGRESGKLLDGVGRKLIEADVEKLIVVEIEDAIAEALEGETRAAASLSCALLSAINEKKQSLKARYKAFRAGSGDRPLCREVGFVGVMCQDCEKIIGQINTSESPSIIRSLDGRPVIDLRTPATTWGCPMCGRSPVRESGWFLTEKWQFFSIGQAETEKDDNTLQEGAKS